MIVSINAACAAPITIPMIAGIMKLVSPRVKADQAIEMASCNAKNARFAMIINFAYSMFIAMSSSASAFALASSANDGNTLWSPRVNDSTAVVNSCAAGP